MYGPPTSTRRLSLPGCPGRTPHAHAPLCVRYSCSDGLRVPCTQQQQQSTAQTGSNPDACNDAMRALRIGSGGGCSSMAQSLPSHSHMAMHAAAPPRKPRVHPSPAPSFAGVPLMALRRVDNVWSLKPTPPHRASAVCIQGVGQNMDGAQGRAHARARVREHAPHAVHALCTHSPCARAAHRQCAHSAYASSMHERHARDTCTVIL